MPVVLPDGGAVSRCRYLVGDVFDMLATIPDGSVDLVLTSPPFLALRSYLPADHPDKHKEIGSEATPADFLDTLLALTVEWRRVLAPHGSICVELGDTYSGSGGAGGDYGDQGMRDGAPKFLGSGRRQRDADTAAGILAPTKRPGPKDRDSISGWPLAKSLTGIPTLYAWSLAYGRNLLRPETTIEPWRVRNLVAWCRPNPPVGALGDKFRPGTSYMTIACVSGKRYFDLDAVRTEGSANTHARTAKGVEARPSTGKTADDERRGGNFSTLATIHATNGAPPLDWWNIPTEPYAGSHYATFPTALLERPIKAMCPARVCLVCGKPSERIAETTNAIGEATGRRSWRNDTEGKHTGDITRSSSSAPTAERTTLGWTDCGHDAWRAGLVLDPFGGSGTTGQVASGHGRDSVLIDIDGRNADLARERVGMFLEVEHLADQGAA